MRASRWAVASVLSPSRSSCSQAAMRNACSDRKPRSLTAMRTLSRSSAEGYRKLREITVLTIENHLSGVVSKWCHSLLDTALCKKLKNKQLTQQSTTKWPHPSMFQYRQKPTTTLSHLTTPGLCWAYLFRIVRLCPELSPIVPNSSALVRNGPFLSEILTNT